MRTTHKIPDLIDPTALNTTNGQEAWRVLGIMAEFAIATERLRGIRPNSLSIASGDTLPHVAELDTAGMGVRVEPAQVKVRNRELAARTSVAPAP